jgi:hypothetical protein
MVCNNRIINKTEQMTAKAEKRRNNLYIYIIYKDLVEEVILSSKSVLKKKARREMHTELPVPEEKIERWTENK